MGAGRGWDGISWLPEQAEMPCRQLPECAEAGCDDESKALPSAVSKWPASKSAAVGESDSPLEGESVLPPSLLALKPSMPWPCPPVAECWPHMDR